jgi:DNA helicase-2/ATP-dependent DNA helicase PcrA
LNQERENYSSRVQQKTRDKNNRNIARIESQLENIASVRRFKYESGSDYLKGTLGHDDIIKMVPQLIKNRPLLTTLIAQKYPFFFVDESQDTFPDIVEALRVVAQQRAEKFCLGFFGDPMQQIYVSGIGDIHCDDSWKKITKPENFRCPATVLSLVNNIRSQGDGLEQTQGRQQLSGVVEKGTAKLFILPTDNQRSQNLDRVRNWLANACSDPHWRSDSKEPDVRILVIVHRMAAARLGFPDLYSAFNDNAPDSFSTGFREGNAWPLKPFLEVLLPLGLAFSENRQFDVISLLRRHCPRLEKDSLKSVENSADLLASLRQDVSTLADLLFSNTDVLEALQFADRAHLMKIDERLKGYLGSAQAENLEDFTQASISDSEDGDGTEYKVAASMAAYLACPVKQLFGYHNYINDQSLYSTQQGIKGAEFERVLVVLDDEESKHVQFSYDKLLGLKEPSKADLENLKQNKETVLDRTRRLFYVCCSRATKDLAVVLYASDVAGATAKLKASALFSPEEIHTLDDIY